MKMSATPSGNEIVSTKTAGEAIPEEDELGDLDDIEEKEDQNQTYDTSKQTLDSTDSANIEIDSRQVEDSATVETQGEAKGSMSPNQQDKAFNKNNPDDDTSVRSTRLLNGSNGHNDQKSAEKADETNGDDETRESVQQTTTGVEVGLGEKKATLYLSRAASMVRTNRPIDAFETNEIANDLATPMVVVEESKDSEQQKATPETVTVTEPSILALSREFTFTGYDIMADEPVKKVKTKIELQREKASRLYRTTCHRLDIIPASYLCERLMDSTIKMKSHGLGPTGTKAVAIALVENFYVESLDLEDNAIGAEGARCLAQMLDDNTSITDLGIAENLIGSEGFAPIADVMSTNQFIARLDISGNGLDDDDAILLKQMLETNRYLLNLKASHNKFGEQGAVHIAKALAINESLEILDISWNHIRGKGAVALATSLKKNIGLKVLNASWNGFAADGCVALGKALKVNTTLQELNLICNRIETTAVGPLINGVQRNTSLTVLRLGQNPMTPDVCLAVLKGIEKSTKTVLKVLDMEGMVVDREFEQLVTSMQEQRPLTVLTGASVRTSELLQGDDTGFSGMDPVKLLFEYTSREGLRIIDLFTSLDRDGSRSVSHEEFREGLLSVDVPLTEDQIEQLIEKLDKDKDGEVDFSILQGLIDANLSKGRGRTKERS